MNQLNRIKRETADFNITYFTCGRIKVMSILNLCVPCKPRFHNKHYDHVICLVFFFKSFVLIIPQPCNSVVILITVGRCLVKNRLPHK